MIHGSRIRPLNRKEPADGGYVLYWMQASQRAEYNHALEFAIQHANQRRQPLIVYFGLTDAFPEANARHYHFMLEGLKQTGQQLNDRGAAMVIERTSPPAGVVKLAGRASLVVCDCGYLRIQKQWRQQVARSIDCPLLQVETDVLVPVDTASPREEYSAATLRRKLAPLVPGYLVALPQESLTRDAPLPEFDSYDISDTARAVSDLRIDRSVGPVAAFPGGTHEAKRRLDDFINNKLATYGTARNDPNRDGLSGLSPYLHFGQISPLYICLQIDAHGGPGRDAFLEELVVRRELSMNYVHYNPHYDSFAGLPDWAQRTLRQRRDDPRDYSYTREQLENALTHDPYWNAAHNEMVLTGKMHGYMRMYWGKKVLDWTSAPEDAFATALYLNNKYELDGRDPNGFAGVAWCFGKHDRPWQPHAVFGNVRYMSAPGLRRKFDADSYARRYAR